MKQQFWLKQKIRTNHICIQPKLIEPYLFKAFSDVESHVSIGDELTKSLRQ